MAKKTATVTDEQAGLPKTSADIPMPPVKSTADPGVAQDGPTLDEVREANGGLPNIVPTRLDPGDLLLVASGDRAVEEQVIRINRAFRAQGISNLVLVAPTDTEIRHVRAEDMNRAGWYRRDSE